MGYIITGIILVVAGTSYLIASVLGFDLWYSSMGIDLDNTLYWKIALGVVVVGIVSSLYGIYRRPFSR